ncbi:hypothetical protein ACFPRL_26750 [Pseudoclavibacter helvolus]
MPGVAPIALPGCVLSAGIPSTTTRSSAEPSLRTRFSPGSRSSSRAPVASMLSVST